MRSTKYFGSNMQKKLLFIITKSEIGGTQRFLYELVTRLNLEKYDILIASGKSLKREDDLFTKLSRENIKTIKIRNFSNMFGIKNLLAFFEIFKIIKNEKPDIVYLLSSEAGFSGSIAAFIYRFGRKKPKIIYRIGGWAFKEPHNIFIKKMYLLAEKISAPFKDIIIVNSEFDRQLAIKNKIAKPKKIITIYNGIDLNKIKFLPKEIAGKIIESKIGNYILVGTVTNLYKNKGIKYLISAISKIGNIDKLHFIIIGEGPEREDIENLIKKYKLEDCISLTGEIKDAYKYLKIFDLFVLPSVKEGQPWAILEAIAAEVPIVATNIAGIPEMIKNEKSGLLVEPADSDSLATAIEKMLTHPSLAHEMTQNAFTAVKEKFKISDMIRKNEELF